MLPSCFCTAPALPSLSPFSSLCWTISHPGTCLSFRWLSVSHIQSLVWIFVLPRGVQHLFFPPSLPGLHVLMSLSLFFCLSRRRHLMIQMGKYKARARSHSFDIWHENNQSICWAFRMKLQMSVVTFYDVFAFKRKSYSRILMPNKAIHGIQQDADADTGHNLLFLWTNPHTMLRSSWKCLDDTIWKQSFAANTGNLILQMYCCRGTNTVKLHSFLNQWKWERWFNQLFYGACVYWNCGTKAPRWELIRQ